jgi:heme oxygenase
LIRASTEDVHRELEASLEVARSDADDRAYVRYLEAMLGWVGPLERELWARPWPQRITPKERAGKVAWIESDLRARGLNEWGLAQIPRQAQLPQLESLAQRFGAAYVLEGAQLGGSVLLRRIGPLIAPLPTRWLVGYGPECGDKWRTFLVTLEAELAQRRQAEVAAASARATFEMVREWLSLRGAA